MKNPYQTLGIEPTATAAEIKAAWRALCAQHHPDRGGDPAAMAEINAAYEVLSDPQRRLAYEDAQADTLEGTAIDMLQRLFDQVIEAESVANPVKEVWAMLDEVRKQMQGRIKVANKRMATLRKRIKQLKSKDPRSFIHVMVERKIAKDEETIRMAKMALEVNDAARRILKDLDWVEEDRQEPVRRAAFSPFGSVMGNWTSSF